MSRLARMLRTLRYRWAIHSFGQPVFRQLSEYTGDARAMLLSADRRTRHSRLSGQGLAAACMAGTGYWASEVGWPALVLWLPCVMVWILWVPAPRIERSTETSLVIAVTGLPPRTVELETAMYAIQPIRPGNRAVHVWLTSGDPRDVDATVFFVDRAARELE